jgi:predicted RNA methylase
MVKKTSYHHNLTSDPQRLAGFYEAIKEKAKGIVYDLGTGSGILSIWAVPFSDFIYAVEKDPVVAEKTSSYLGKFKNILFIEGDARKVHFPEKSDLIICEMLDTALIDEEQVPVLNSVLDYLKKGGDVIPRGILNGVEPVHTDAEYLCYEENGKPSHQLLGPLIIYSHYDFRKPINPLGDFEITMKISKKGTFSGLKITTFTLITPNIICGPTPMLNPPLIIPTEELYVEEGEIVTLNLSYVMGGGLDSIKTKIKKIS